MAILGAFFDANVLYPSGLRNFLMHLSLTGIFRAHWSAEVHDEYLAELNTQELCRSAAALRELIAGQDSII